MSAEDWFLDQLAEGIIAAGGAGHNERGRAINLAGQVLAELRKLEPDSFANIVEFEEMRFVFQWDEDPQVLIILVWVETMWQDMARVEVPVGML